MSAVGANRSAAREGHSCRSDRRACPLPDCRAEAAARPGAVRGLAAARLVGVQARRGGTSARIDPDIGAAALRARPWVLLETPDRIALGRRLSRSVDQRRHEAAALLDAALGTALGGVGV